MSPDRVDLSNEAIHWSSARRSPTDEYLQLNKILDAQKPHAHELRRLMFMIDTMSSVLVDAASCLRESYQRRYSPGRERRAELPVNGLIRQSTRQGS